MEKPAIEGGLPGTIDGVDVGPAEDQRIDQRRVGGGEAADVVIAPPALIEELAKAGKLDGSGRAAVGRVGVGVLVPSAEELELLKPA